MRGTKRNVKMGVKRVLFKAPALTYSGYGVHSRQVARYLVGLADAGKIDLYIELVRWGNTPWELRNGGFGGLAGRINKYYFRHAMNVQEGREVKYDVTVQLVLPNEWEPRTGAFNVGMSAVVEGTKCNPLWVDACNAMNMVIVPSQHALGVLKSSGELQTPTHVIPEAYFDALVQDPKPVDWGFKTGFNFLTVAQLTSPHPVLDRKNTVSTISHLCDVFRNDPDVGVVVKTNSGRGTKIDRKVTIDRFKSLVDSARRGEYPRVYLIHGDMDDSEVAALYRDPTMRAFVSLTRGEGFGLPILEAAVAGLPVIATDWSGHMDFMSKGRFIPVGYDLDVIPDQKVDRNKPEHRDRDIWVQGARWAAPIEGHVKRALKKFRKSPDIPTGWAEALSLKLRQSHSSSAIQDMYNDVLGPILGVTG